jgi:hypothetical protein
MPDEILEPHKTPQAKIIHQLRFIMIGAKHWRGMNMLFAPNQGETLCSDPLMHQKMAN